jgi:hypothetical protein
MSAPATETIRFAGDVIIRRLEVVSSANYKVDMTNQLIGIEIYEDIFSPFITMAISIRESQDFINALPLRGEEIINLEISTPTLKNEDQVIKGKFYVYKLSDRQLLTDRNSAYTLYCISYEALYDLNIKQSKAYSGNVGEIVLGFLQKEGFDTIKKINIEPTKNAIKYISNFWSPVKNINVLTTNAISNSGSPSYLFYESRKGFNFVTLDSLYKQNVFQKFIKDNYVRDTDKTISYRNLDRDYQRILDFKVKVSYDALQVTSNGAYASRIYAYDLVKKKLFAKDYNALANFNDTAHLNKNALYTTKKPVSPMNLIFNEIRHFGAWNGFQDTSNINTQQQRNSMLALLRSSVIEISVFGRTDYTIGQKIFVQVPKPTIITDKDKDGLDSQSGTVDKTYSGNYIITAINHVINRNSHTCLLELSKESVLQ